MTFDEAAALFVGGRLPGEALPDLAISLLQVGVDSPAVRELAALTRPTLRDASDLFLRMLRELGRTLPTKVAAARALAKDLAFAVLNGQISLREAARRGARLASAFDYAESLMAFYLADDDYDVPLGPLGEIDARLKKHCEAVIRDEGE